MDALRAERRRFLSSLTRGGMALAGHSFMVGLLAGCARPGAPTPVAAAATGASRDAFALQPMVDPSTGKVLLELPEGFRYFSFGWAGQTLDDGVVCPGAADGMGVVAVEGDVLTLVRNQEVWSDTPHFGPAAQVWDPMSGGGTTTLKLDLRAERLLESRSSLGGTCANCSGGVTPWGSWLSCEEFVVSAAEAQANQRGEGSTRFQREHGFVFEVPSAGAGSAQPLRALGQFRHEAVAVDPHSGIVYLTEDHNVHSGFYRFLPDRPGDLGRGRLQMLKAKGAADLRGGQPAHARYAVEWVDIAEPTRAHQPGTLDQAGVVSQGLAQGATAFHRLEGVLWEPDTVYFTSTCGGAAGAGQVWKLAIAAQQLELVYESPAVAVMDYPDQMTRMGDALVMCQDSKRTAAQVLYWMGPQGVPRTFARNAVEGYRTAEWSGVCPSPDGRWLFANIYTPGFSVAITGPWERLRG